MKKILTITASIALLAAGSMTAAAQNSTRNIGPAPNNIGPGPVPSQCVAFTVARTVFVRVCGAGYTASGAGTRCSGGAWSGRGSYSLSPGGCGNGQQFLGGNLSCFNGAQCTWTPSPAGFQAGFQRETVYVQYQ